MEKHGWMPRFCTPVAEASVQFGSSPSFAFSACSGAASCTMLSDQSRIALTYMTVLSAGVMTLAANWLQLPIPESVELQVTSLTASVRVSVCVGPNSRIIVHARPLTRPWSKLRRTSCKQLRELPQIAPPGQNFRPVTVRAKDSATPPHPVLGAHVVFLAHIGRMGTE